MKIGNAWKLSLVQGACFVAPVLGAGLYNMAEAVLNKKEINKETVAESFIGNDNIEKAIVVANALSFAFTVFAFIKYDGVAWKNLS